MPKFCTKCGNRLQEKDKFCRKCGAPVKMMTPEPSAENSMPSYDAPQSYSVSGSSAYENPEGTVLLGSMNKMDFSGPSVKKAELRLSLNEMLEGCSKAVDFGTGKKYELSIPAGLSPGDVIVVEDPGLIDGDTGKPCKIELTVMLG